MKQSKVLIVFLFSVLLVFGWFTTINNIISGVKNGEYKKYIANAEEYMERKLYQKAIEQYNLALQIKDTEQLQSDILNAYGKRYEESKSSYDDYLEAAKNAEKLYPKTEEFVLTVEKLAVSQEDYNTAYMYLNDAINAGLKSEKVNNELLKVKYSYKLDYNAYTNVKPYSNGFFAVEYDGKWKYITTNGDKTLYEEAKFVGQVGKENIKIFENKNELELIDEDDIVQGKINVMPDDVRGCADGILPVKIDGKYSYYKLIGDKAFGNYENASSFVNGKAAAFKNGKWFIIDEDGKRISDKEYDDIKLCYDGTYIKNNIMIASIDGKYKMYDDNEKVIGKNEYEDIESAGNDEYIAFCEDGKWGFLDNKGKVLIRPQYESARSFSNGLAGVYNGKKWGFINLDNKLVIDYNFFDVDNFTESGTCMVETGKDNWQLLKLNVS